MATDQLSQDDVLFHAIRGGDEKAFDVLFLKYYPMLCAYANQLVDLEDAKEIVQDVMVWFWENREMQLYEGAVKNYLFKMTKNRCLTLINRNEVKRRISMGLSEQQKEQYDDPDFYIVEELTRKIEDAIAKLPDTYREAFELNRFHQLTYAEIAEKVHVSKKTVDYRIQQALKLLRHELRDYLPFFLFWLN